MRGPVGLWRARAALDMVGLSVTGVETPAKGCGHEVPSGDWGYGTGSSILPGAVGECEGGE